MPVNVINPNHHQTAYSFVYFMYFCRHPSFCFFWRKVLSTNEVQRQLIVNYELLIMNYKSACEKSNENQLYTRQKYR